MANSREPPPRIEDYGLIGDMHTCALVGKNGSIDFLCWPAFDSPSIFARILDTTKGSAGHWSIRPRLPSTSYLCKQNYLPSTNVLVTKFIHEDGVIDLTDFFAIFPVQNGLRQAENGRALVRKAECLRGKVTLDIDIQPRPGYASTMSAPLTVTGPQGRPANAACFQSLVFSQPTCNGGPPDPQPWFQVVFCPSAGCVVENEISPVWAGVGGQAHATIELIEGQCIYIIMRQESDCDRQKPEDLQCLQQVFDLEHQTSSFWRSWVRSCTYHGRFQQEVERSMLILKLLTYEPTGAIVAAPTFSLPEAIGGGRQWDYRYSWVRDSSFTVYVFLKMGFATEAEAYINFIFR